jgi:methyl-accepting chemotaxis protein
VLDESGYKAMKIGGEASHVFYRVLRNEKWGIAIICPDHEMLGGFYRLLTTAVIGALVALLLLLFVCRKLIDGNLKSLDLLSETVRHMSHNQFDKPIPYLGRKDEIGELQLSFAKMQKALKSHIDEIHLKTDTLKQQNAELQSAYERGREDERTKAAFLSQTTEKFMQPVNAIGAAAERLCSQYQDVSKEETEALLADITSNTEVVTNLIGQMLVTSQSTNHTNPTNSADL